MAPASCLIPSITVSVGPLDLVQRQTCCWEIAFVMNWQEACTGRQQGTQQATSWQLGMAGALSGELQDGKCQCKQSASYV
uniref:Uncharacterized protein n=1 Tax=Tetradesmus obliquus TaxID=3088 RepID=A0A383VJR2_TETOB